MACGTPVVATGTGGSAEYLRDGENCLLVPPGDADALAAAVARLRGRPRPAAPRSWRAGSSRPGSSASTRYADRLREVHLAERRDRAGR